MKTPVMWTRLALYAAILCMSAMPAFAQEEFGGLYGSVTDGSDTLIPGVSVSLAGLGATQQQISDGQGNFRFPRLDPGVYHLEAKLDGFSTLEYTNVDIRAGRNTTLALQLSAALEEVITVTSETPLLDERKLSQGTLLAETDLKNVPTAGDPWSILNQAPGVEVDRVDVGGSRNFQSNFTAPGVRSSQNDFLLDGVQITDMAGLGASSTYYDMEQFNQVEVSSGGNDISKVTAGVSINMVTKRGTNEFRGSARFLVTDEDLFWFFKQSSPDVDPADFPPGQDTNIETTQINTIQNYGFEAGGPVIRDRLWFWGSYGKNEVAETAVGGFPQDSTVESAAFKLNAQLSSANSLLGSWNNNDKLVPNRGIGINLELEASRNQRGPTALMKLEDTHVFSSNLFLTGTLVKHDGGFSATSNSCIAAGSCDLAAEGLLDSQGVWRNSIWSGYSHRPSNEFKIDGSYFFGAGGLSHELKFGGRYRVFETSSLFVWPGGRNIGQYASETVGLPPEMGMFFAKRGEGPPISMEYTSFWVQDTLSFGNWTLNAGLRYDLQDGENDPSSVEANPAVPEFMPAVEFEGNDGGGFDWQSVVPRLGVTYALGAARQTLLRGSYSQFARSLGAGTISRVNPVDLAYGYFVFVDENNDDLWAGPEEEFFLVAWSGYDPTNPTDLSSPNRTDPNLDPEITQELVLGVEHAFLPELVVGLNVTWRNTSDILEHRDFLRECQTEACDSGPVRLARREDYVPFRSIDVTQPDGSPYTVDFYTLDPARFAFTGGDLLLNGEREVNYFGSSLTVTKRLTNQWMLRGFINYGKPKWDIPDSFFEYDDPTDDDAFNNNGYDNDGDLFAESGGRFGQLVMHSTWSFNVNGMYQIAPNRPWGFNIAGNIYGREGYPIPLYARQFSPDVGIKYAQAMASADDFRYDDLYTIDLRFDKEFAASGNVSFTVSADVFNVLNEGVVLQREAGLNLRIANYVLETLSPRIWRLGARINWR